MVLVPPPEPGVIVAGENAVTAIPGAATPVNTISVNDGVISTLEKELLATTIVTVLAAVKRLFCVYKPLMALAAQLTATTGVAEEDGVK